MPRPIVFISYSAPQDSKEYAYIQSLHAELEQAGLEVFHDRVRLRPGGCWHEELDRWIELCHGAILVITEAALRSDWVTKEITILAWRRMRDPSFILLPVITNGVSNDDIRQHYHAQGLDTIQCLRRTERASGPTDIQPEIIHAFHPLTSIVASTALQTLEIDLGAILQRSAPHRIPTITSELGAAIPTATVIDDRATYVARLLMRAHPSQIIQVIESLTLWLDARIALHLFDTLMSFWVDAMPAHQLWCYARDLTRSQPVGVNGSCVFTGRMYIRRAASNLLSWTTIEIESITANQPGGAARLAEERIAWLAARTSSISDARTHRQCELFAEQRPILVMFLGIYSGETVAKICEQFQLSSVLRRCRLLFLTGDPDDPERNPYVSGIEFLDPPLEPGSDLEKSLEYDVGRSIIKAAYIRLDT